MLQLSNMWAAVVVSALGAGSAVAQFDDFTQWTLIEDPAHPQFNASATSTAATLTAGNGAIPAGTDIGYASVNGQDAADSTSGFVFSPDNDFLIGVDFDLSFANSPAASGALGVGFGIGEDIDGTNSAGVAVISADGASSGPAGAVARTNDVNLTPQPLSLNAPVSGSMFVSFEQATGNVTVGLAPTLGAIFADASTLKATYAGVQQTWAGDDLLASFFLRSDTAPIFAPTAWAGGDATAVFSNLRVLEGGAIAVPEPGSLLLLLGLGAGLVGRRRVKI